MFGELEKYKSVHFFVHGNEDKKNACNAKSHLEYT